MVQPKKPPVSFRPGDERQARIDAYAEKHKLSRHLAILTLIDAGLRSDGPSLPPPAVQAAIKAKAAKAQTAARPFTSRLKGEWKAP